MRPLKVPFKLLFLKVYISSAQSMHIALKSILIRISWKIHLPKIFRQMGRILFACWMHGNMPHILGNFEGRWIFQVTLIKNGLYYPLLPKDLAYAQWHIFFISNISPWIRIQMWKSNPFDLSSASNHHYFFVNMDSL